MDNTLFEEQLRLEKLYKEQASQAFLARTEREKEKGRASATAVGKATERAMIDTFALNVRNWLNDTTKKKCGRPQVYRNLVETLKEHTEDLKELELIMCTFTLEIALNDIGGRGARGVSHLSRIIGTKIFLEVKTRAFLKQYPYLENKTMSGLDKRVQEFNKMKYIENILDHHHIDGLEKPTTKEQVALGAHLLNILVASTNLLDMRIQDGKSMELVPTQEFLELWRNGELKIASKCYFGIPTVIPPNKWESTRYGGYYGVLRGRPSLLRLKFALKNTRTQQDYIRRLRELELEEVREAVNRVQETPYRINKRILEVMDTIIKVGGNVAGIPYAEPLAELGRLEGEPSKEELKEHKIKIQRRIHAEISRQSRMRAILCAVDMARDFSEYERIYFPCSMDFRGRIYPIPVFNYQGSDVNKGLIQYADPVACTNEDDLELLEIQGCNLSGNDKISLGDRVKWTKEHQERIISCAEEPLGDLWWADMDEPFQFLAFCFEYKRALDYINEHGSIVGFKCHITIAFDGTCSGLQHYSALLQDEIGGSAVNLIDHDVPADIYQVVADKILPIVEQDALNGTLDEQEEGKDLITYGTRRLATAWLEYGVTRKVTKRPVMTLAYGSARYGFQQQLLEDITRHDEVFTGIENPSARYMSGLIWDAVQSEVRSATEGMQYLKDIAKELVDGGQPANWWTPLGLPVQQYYLKTKVVKFRTRFGGSCSIPLYYRDVDEEEALAKGEQRNGIAPNFIHSLDATHLMMVILAGKLKHYTTVHDSFGTSLGEASKLRQVIREQLYKLYTEYKPLESFRLHAEHVLGRRLDIKEPKKGNLKLESILESSYVFH